MCFRWFELVSVWIDSVLDVEIFDVQLVDFMEFWHTNGEHTSNVVLTSARLETGRSNKVTEVVSYLCRFEYQERTVRHSFDAVSFQSYRWRRHITSIMVSCILMRRNIQNETNTFELNPSQMIFRHIFPINGRSCIFLNFQKRSALWT